jgi:hypothetical protein
MSNLIQPVRESYAHNSRLYEYMATQASLQQIVEFLTWDAEQPAFYVYLRHWLDKTPAAIRPALQEHIDEEEGEDHSGMFKRMFSGLQALAGNPTVEMNPAVLERLNYVFSAQCAQEQNVGFFIGGFLATEFMSQKRCQQLLDGLRRLQVEFDEEYLVLHAEADAHHWIEVDEKLAEPALANGFASIDAIQVGINHRLQSSANFLKYYENKYLYHRQLKIRFSYFDDPKIIGHQCA